MPQPTEHDVMVVQDKLAELYASLTPAQQDVLDTIMAAGLSFIDEDDTGGFVFTMSSFEAEAHMRHRVAELQESWRQANFRTDTEQAPARRPRWDLKPLLAWLNRTEPSPA